MIKEAIDRILELAAPNTLCVPSGINYTDKRLYTIENERRAEPVHLSTLTSLVKYIRVFPENKKDLPYLIHVASPTSVEMLSALDGDRKREVLVSVEADLPIFAFGRFMSNEDMIIKVQSMFVDDDKTDRKAVLQFTGTVTSGTIKEYGDDGVTQQAVIKQGVASKANAIVPSPCTLRPYRTFLEVEQPASKFIFRMKQSGDTVESALFESDGGAWKAEAKRNIVRYLEKELADTNVAVIW